MAVQRVRSMGLHIREESRILFTQPSDFRLVVKCPDGKIMGGCVHHGTNAPEQIFLLTQGGELLIGFVGQTVASVRLAAGRFQRRAGCSACLAPDGVPELTVIFGGMIHIDFLLKFENLIYGAIPPLDFPIFRA